MKLNSPLNPLAKTDGLVVQELPDELLVYDLEKNKAYDLNQTSALVWQNCDGHKSISEIAQVLEKTLNQKVPDELVWLALEKLNKEGLVNYQKEEFTQFTSINRRELVKRASLASLVALPLVASLVAPTAANAQSGVINPACTACTTGIGTDQPLGACGATNCPGVCMCFGNNSCNGIGQAASPTNSCDDCRSVTSGSPAMTSTNNNSFQCI